MSHKQDVSPGEVPLPSPGSVQAEVAVDRRRQRGTCQSDRQLRSADLGVLLLTSKDAQIASLEKLQPSICTQPTFVSFMCEHETSWTFSSVGGDSELCKISHKIYIFCRFTPAASVCKCSVFQVLLVL